MRATILILLLISNTLSAINSGEPTSSPSQPASNKYKKIMGHPVIRAINNHITVVECKAPKNQVCMYIVKSVPDNQFNDMCNVAQDWNPNQNEIDLINFNGLNYAYAIPDSIQQLNFIPCIDVNISCENAETQALTVEIIH